MTGAPRPEGRLSTSARCPTSPCRPRRIAAASRQGGADHEGRREAAGSAAARRPAQDRGHLGHPAPDRLHLPDHPEDHQRHRAAARRRIRCRRREGRAEAAAGPQDQPHQQHVDAEDWAKLQSVTRTGHRAADGRRRGHRPQGHLPPHGGPAANASTAPTA